MGVQGLGGKVRVYPDLDLDLGLDFVAVVCGGVGGR